MKDTEYLKQAVRALHEANVNFVLIGGLAMIAHGVNCLTQDIDFAYGVDSENLERCNPDVFLRRIQARVLGRSASDGFVITPALLQRVRFLNLFTDLGEVDVMREVPGMDSFERLWERAIPLDLGGFTVRVASIDDLLAMKRAANRPKDQTRIHELLTQKNLMNEEQ